MQRIRNNLILKKAKVKITNDFIASKETLNAKTFKNYENNAQLNLHNRIMNELFKNNYRSEQNKSIISLRKKHVKSSMKNLF